MKIIKLLFSTAIIVSLTLLACQKDDPTAFVLPPNPSPTPTSAIGDFFKNNLEDATQSFTVNPNNYSITGNKGTVITFNDNTFTYANGNAVVGNFTIELIEAQHKRDMLRLNKQTVTKDGQLLVSGGIVYVNATQNGQQLSINDSNPVQASIPTDNYLAMDYFTGGDDANGDFGWDLSVDDTVTTNTAIDSTGQGGEWELFLFDFSIDSVGWINCDYFYSSGDPLTDVEVDLPEDYNGSNTMVFVYYSDINAVANMNDSDEDGTFNLGYSYETPVGMDVSFIVVSEIDGSYYYAIVAATITDNHLEIIDDSAINGPFTEEDIENFMNSL
ncbi:MAG: hypothetical protein H8D62_02280 [Bacteroidetes bacterium]|nr:hypothetical protein [Bacteroidota bacterium]